MPPVHAAKLVANSGNTTYGIQIVKGHFHYWKYLDLTEVSVNIIQHIISHMEIIPGLNTRFSDKKSDKSFLIQLYISNPVRRCMRKSQEQSVYHYMLEVVMIIHSREQRVLSSGLPYTWWRHEMETFSAEFTGHRWIPRTKASDAMLWCFLWSVPEQTID